MKTYLSELTKSNKTLKFDWELFDSQATKQNSVFLMVNGTFKAMDGKISTFVQSFLLLKEHPKVLVSNDFLIILENAIPQSVKKLTDYVSLLTFLILLADIADYICRVLWICSLT